MLHLLKRLPRKIAVSRMATSLALAVLWLPSATAARFYTAVIIIVSVPLQQAFELRRVYIQFVSRNYNLSGIGARRRGRNREEPLSACLPALGNRPSARFIFPGSIRDPKLRDLFDRVDRVQNRRSIVIGNEQVLFLYNALRLDFVCRRQMSGRWKLVFI